MTYREAVAWLFGTQKFGIKLGLENITRLLRALEVPAQTQRIIHVAGTNGKGSVCAMLDRICRAQGYRTGLFTSPHLVSFCERIQVDGELISENAAAEGLTAMRELVRAWEPHPTFFEIATALALLHFRETACQIIVLETGMGGRLDATNALTPVVSVITPIALDHQKWLGDTLGKIAGEKAGIIKPGTPCVSSAQPAEAEAVLRARAAECGSALSFVTEPTAHEVALAGAHQKENAALALAALRAGEIEASPRAIAQGLATVEWPARFQQCDARLVIDGAHNPAGAHILARTWRDRFGGEKATVIFGALADKDIAASWRELHGIAHAVILPHFRGERVVPPAEVARAMETITPEIPITIASDVAEAIATARRSPARILLCGSLHLAGEALASLRGIPGAFEECAQ